MLMMGDVRETDLDFEPHGRPRSCTWPLPCPEDFPGGDENLDYPFSAIKVEHDCVPACSGERNAVALTGLRRSSGVHAPQTTVLSCIAETALDVAGHLRKAKSSRRNAWGNQSYADLITRAIESTPDRRLTLSQIYDWMVRYVPYFKDKGDSNSSAGWKNSIRHNLSLHTRFIRVQNEGTGKSSWWMLNPEGGKMGKAPRRRATSVDGEARCAKGKGRSPRRRIAGGAGPGPQRSPEHGSPAGRAAGGGRGEGAAGFDTWTGFHSRTGCSAAAALIQAEAEPRKPEEEEAPSCSTSPRVYQSPTGTCSPASEVPRPLAALAGSAVLDDGYAQAQGLELPTFPYTVPGSKGQGSFCGSVYRQPAMNSTPQHHSPLQTIQENKAVSFHGSLRAYPGSGTLQDLLASGPQYCGDSVDGDLRPLMSNSRDELAPHIPNQTLDQGPGRHRNHRQAPVQHSHSQTCEAGHTLSQDSSHELSPRQSCELVHCPPQQQGPSPQFSSRLLPAYSLKASDLYSPHSHDCAQAAAPAALPPNPASTLGAPLDSCPLATAPHPRQQPCPGGYFQGTVDPQPGSLRHLHLQDMNYNGQQYPRPTSDFSVGSDHSNADCNVESVLFGDYVEPEEMDFNFDCSVSQGVGAGAAPSVGVGAGFGVWGFGYPRQAHGNQDWVPS